MASLLLSLKLCALSLTVICIAMLLKLSIPTLTEFANSDLPSVFTVLMTWLRPPYLYVVINGIIITIFASSKLHHRKHHVEAPPAYFLDANIAKVIPTTYNDVVVHDVYYDALPEEETKVMTSSYINNPVATINKSFGDQKFVENSNNLMTEFDVYGVYGVAFDVKCVDDVAVMKTTEKEPTEFFEDEVAVAVGVAKGMERKSWEFPDSRSERPPVSVRTNHKKSVKSIGDGGRALRVSKKRQENLENTWKTITEGRSNPPTRHLRKSDTLKSHDHQLPQDPDPKMTKTDTVHVQNTHHVSNNSSPGLGRLRKEPSGSWKLKKDPSLSQDDLNRRVEDFINKFNEDMRLQRQESLQQYMQMINRGAAH